MAQIVLSNLARSFYYLVTVTCILAPYMIWNKHNHGADQKAYSICTWYSILQHFIIITFIPILHWQQNIKNMMSLAIIETKLPI